MRLIDSALKRQNVNRPPVWLMRQAGRYHSHYQKIKARYSFIEICKIPEVACEVTMGPIQDFNFDAAIVFSDLLFPLESMGFGLTYREGPVLDFHLKSTEDLARITCGKISDLRFQAEAMTLIRQKLDPNKALLGFVGGPFTLYCYAVEGSHQGGLEDAKRGIADGRMQGFYEKLEDLLVGNMILQAESGADAVAVLDTCGGELDPLAFSQHVVPMLDRVLKGFKKVCPKIPVIYYSKKTDSRHWESLVGLPIECLGVDWNVPLDQVLSQWGSRFAIQGNIDPNWLLLETHDFENRVRSVFEKVKALPAEVRRGWICGLGHGVLPKTPEAHVRLFTQLNREYFS